MRFVDLFAGLGGFHVGLSSLGHKCVFTSEIDEELRTLYEQNFGFSPHGDIKKIHEDDIPEHDILCAGFPCQPFSKAGAQLGLTDIDRGTLFYDIARILKAKRPQYFILENVPNILTHDKGKTWDTIRQTLEQELGYSIDSRKLSPHCYGIPQIRDRVFIIGSYTGLKDFEWPEKYNGSTAISDILDHYPKSARTLPARERSAIDLWQRFLDVIPKSSKFPSFPIWSMEFGASYPFEGKAPYHYSREELDGFLGEFGSSLHGMTKSGQLERLPHYARATQKGQEFPNWKKGFIRQNRKFYSEHKHAIDPLLLEIQKLPPSWQKFEWNCQGERRNLDSLIIQFRGSGIRVKRSNYSPSLVASTSTQIPVITWQNRYLSTTEAARLQSLEGINLPKSDSSAYKALGNAVNAKLVRLIASKLISNSEQITTRSQVEVNAA